MIWPLIRMISFNKKDIFDWKRRICVFLSERTVIRASILTWRTSISFCFSFLIKCIRCLLYRNLSLFFYSELKYLYAATTLTAVVYFFPSRSRALFSTSFLYSASTYATPMTRTWQGHICSLHKLFSLSLLKYAVKQSYSFWKFVPTRVGKIFAFRRKFSYEAFIVRSGQILT